VYSRKEGRAEITPSVRFRDEKAMASTLQAGAMPPVPVNGIGVTAVELLCVRLMGLALVISS
jgi:hypothetical protein